MGQALIALVTILAWAGCGGNGADPESDPPAALRISPDTLPVGTLGAGYAVTLFGSGGSGAGYAWTLTSGSLPPGIGGLPATGSTARLLGTPNTTGVFAFTVSLTDSDSARQSKAYLITVSEPPGFGGWQALTTSGAPGARSGHTAVWTGTEMIVWGGSDDSSLLDTGGAYDPARRTWRTISRTGAPVARTHHTAVWTGAEMIVWGGSDGASALATGGAYDPARDSWRPLTSTGAPEARVLHTAVWAGAAMIVWGGQGNQPPPAPNSVDRVLGDGAAYDPVRDVWSPIAGGGAPPARGHVAVWTGHAMVVWGGRDGFALSLSTVDSGGIYTPSADAWSATAAAGAPAARVEHTAVWTGTEMIVWGGWADVGGITGLTVGGAYEVAADSWSQVSTAGSPTTRIEHTAVWTGTEMIVWGGAETAQGNFPTDTGGAYDPSTGLWRATRTVGAPSARIEHTAVWTGTEMIVWGGRGNPAATYLNSGSRFTP